MFGADSNFIDHPEHMFVEHKDTVAVLKREGLLVHLDASDDVGEETRAAWSRPAFVLLPDGDEREESRSAFELRLEEVREAVEFTMSHHEERHPWPADIDKAWFWSVMWHGTSDVDEALKFFRALDRVTWIEPEVYALWSERLDRKKVAELNAVGIAANGVTLQ